jgi:hypothetical protein
MTLGYLTHELHVKVFTTSFRKVEDTTYQNVPGGISDLPISAADKDGTPLANGIYYVMVNTDIDRWIVKMLVLR